MSLFDLGTDDLILPVEDEELADRELAEDDTLDREVAMDEAAHSDGSFSLLSPSSTLDSSYVEVDAAEVSLSPAVAIPRSRGG